MNSQTGTRTDTADVVWIKGRADKLHADPPLAIRTKCKCWTEQPMPCIERQTTSDLSPVPMEGAAISTTPDRHSREVRPEPDSQTGDNP